MKLRINVVGGKPEWDDSGQIGMNYKYSDSFDIELTPEQAAMVRLASGYPIVEITGRVL